MVTRLADLRKKLARLSSDRSWPDLRPSSLNARDRIIEGRSSTQSENPLGYLKGQRGLANESTNS